MAEPTNYADALAHLRAVLRAQGRDLTAAELHGVVMAWGKGGRPASDAYLRRLDREHAQAATDATFRGMTRRLDTDTRNAGYEGTDGSRP